MFNESGPDSQDDRRRQQAWQVRTGLLSGAERQLKELEAGQKTAYDEQYKRGDDLLKAMNQKELGMMNAQQVAALKGGFAEVQAWKATHPDITDPEKAMTDPELVKVLAKNPAIFQYVPMLLSGNVASILARHPQEAWGKTLEGMKDPVDRSRYVGDIINSDIDSGIERRHGSEAARESLAGQMASMNANTFGDIEGIKKQRARIAELEADPGAFLQQRLGAQGAAPAAATQQLPPDYAQATDRNGGAVPGIFQNGPHSYTNVPPPEPRSPLGVYSNVPQVSQSAPGGQAPMPSSPQASAPSPPQDYEPPSRTAPGYSPEQHALHASTAQSHVFGARAGELREALAKMTPDQRLDLAQVHGVRHSMPHEHLVVAMNKLLEVTPEGVAKFDADPMRSIRSGPVDSVG